MTCLSSVCLLSHLAESSLIEVLLHSTLTYKISTYKILGHSKVNLSWISMDTGQTYVCIVSTIILSFLQRDSRANAQITICRPNRRWRNQLRKEWSTRKGKMWIVLRSHYGRRKQTWYWCNKLCISTISKLGRSASLWLIFY